jgi:hypothetical protein
MAKQGLDLISLGQAIDTSWGRSSTPRTASYSVKMTLLGSDRLLVSYAAIVNFGSERQMIEVKRAYVEEAQAVIANVLKNVKENYKSLSGQTLKAKQINESDSDSLEMTNMNVHNAKRTAYYRRKAIFEIA